MFYSKPYLERHFLDSLVNVKMFFLSQFLNMNPEWYDLYESEIVKCALFHAQQMICFKELRHTAAHGFHAGWSVVHLVELECMSECDIMLTVNICGWVADER